MSKRNLAPLYGVGIFILVSFTFGFGCEEIGKVRQNQGLRDQGSQSPPPTAPPNPQPPPGPPAPPPMPIIDDSKLDTNVDVDRGPYLQSSTTTSMVIRWRTDTAVKGRIRVGYDVNKMIFEWNENQATKEHVIKATGLRPATRYFYSIGSQRGRLAGNDQQHFFQTHPPVGTPKPTRIWVIGDSGTADSKARAVRNAYYQEAGNRYTDLWLMLGDNAYTDGTDREYQAAVFDMYPNMLKRTPLFSTRGNHEKSASTYYGIFTLPTRGESGGVPSGSEAYYSFDYGNIHFVCLDSTGSKRGSSSAMASWLKDDLANTTSKWTIAFWHHPPYTKGSHNSDSEGPLVEMRANLVPILEDYGVDLVLSGHSHAYERSFLIDGHYGNSSSLRTSMIVDGGNGRVGGDGPYRKPNAAHEGAVYVVAGSSGKVSSDGNLNHPVMKVNIRKLGSMILDINGNTLQARFLRENGQINDSFTIIKDANN